MPGQIMFCVRRGNIRGPGGGVLLLGAQKAVEHLVVLELDEGA